MIRNQDLIPHMRGVLATERDLRDLAVMWQMIESSAAISCPDEVAPILPTLVATRERFDQLQGRLVSQMVQENKAELADELAAKAQCAIDILVRNLYERTADVGFLATDDTVREFCARPQDGGHTPAQMAARLADYRAKYTVYDDIILLDPQGRVLARLDTECSLDCSRDTIVAEALANAGYVERFRSSDLAGADGSGDGDGGGGGGNSPALLYAHRIAAPAQGGNGQAHVGVLVLRFRFADEMRRIFADLHDEDLDLAVVLVDDDQHVVATNEQAHVPTGTTLRRLSGNDMALTAFAGREYVAVCRASAGYQGYRGPAWRAQAMVSMLTAFRQRGQAATGEQLPLDNTELVAMSLDADAINRELRRVVWNGRLMAGEEQGDRTRLKAVLQQVNGAGMRTRERVAMAIADICSTTLGRARRQARSLARLAADIVDRNLYERANDCRWWALSPALQAALAEPASAANSQAMNRVLDHINGLYTVYSRLVVFDNSGRVRGASRLAEQPELIGTAVPQAWVAAVERLHDPQQYAVSPFEATALHQAGPTYVYLAALRSARDGARQPGGIAIVFNAATELQAMLRDVLADRAGYAAFIDNQGQVLASTDPALTAAIMRKLPTGDETALVDHDGTHYACARCVAPGYREFKVNDGYANGVRVEIGLRLGGSERRRAQLGDMSLQMLQPVNRRQTLEAAVFQVGHSRYALPTASLLMAVAPEGLVRTPGSEGTRLGMVEVPEGRGSRLVQAHCARSLFGVGYPSRQGDGALLVLRHPARPDEPVCALRVDDVLAVLDVPVNLVQTVPDGFTRFAPWAGGLFDCLAVGGGQQEKCMVQLLDARRLLDTVQPGIEAAEPPALAVAAGVLAAMR